MKKLFSVTAKCGHIGKRYYIPIAFAVRADSAEEAARKVRSYPRVKHDHKDAIQSVFEISWEEFCSLKQQNEANPYLRCKNIQEQRMILDSIYDRIVEERCEDRERVKNEKTDTTYYIGKELVRNVRKYLKNRPKKLSDQHGTQWHICCLIAT